MERNARGNEIFKQSSFIYLFYFIQVITIIEMRGKIAFILQQNSAML